MILEIYIWTEFGKFGDGKFGDGKFGDGRFSNRKFDNFDYVGKFGN